MKLQQLIFWALILAALGFWGFHEVESRVAEKAQQAARDAEDQRHSQHVEAEAARLNAVTNWGDSLKGSDNLSLAVEDAVKPKDGRPILIRDGMLEDVDHKGEEFFLQVSSIMTGADVEFVLQCDEATARKFSAAGSVNSFITVVAQVASVGKAELAVKSGGSGDDPVQSDSATTTVARGAVVEVIADP